MRFALGLVGALVTACGSQAAPIGSVGAVLGRDPETGAVHVREAPSGLAASAAGLRAGDRIVMIDGILADDLGEAALRRRLRGAVGSHVRLTVIRDDEVLHVELARTPLAEPSPK
jgi:C-terminal processing protease CtpA/Prc